MRSGPRGSARHLLPGKVPVAVLRKLLRLCGAADRSVVLGPTYGSDAAVIDLGDRYLILKSDPVTFTADEIGWYAVHVNANDVAVMGGRPRWFQPTIILPEGSPAEVVVGIMRDIDRAARALGIAVTGGHTEVTPAVCQPIVAGDLQGTVAKGRLVRPGGARPGDAVLMTKTAGIEGTAILAREFPSQAKRILGQTAFVRARRFHHRPGISVVPDAEIAARRGATAMHDPTEGGVATALFEMASASAQRFRIDLDAIAVHPHTERLCAHFGLRPLGLIASGALLATVPAASVRGAIAALTTHQISAAVIGSVERGRGVEARRAGKRVRFEWSERDELTRLAR